MFSKFILRIKRKETPFYNFLYQLAVRARSFNVPTVKAIHLPLYYLDYSIKVVPKRVFHALWSVPVFKARCEKVGRGLTLPNGIPLIIGNHLKLRLGNNVTIFRTTVGASKIYDAPMLEIGDNTTIGFGTFISASEKVSIGNNCLVGPYCMIMDSDDHPINPQKRLSRGGVNKDEVIPVKIGDNVWIGAYCTILKGVTIGDNAVIAAHSFVSKDVIGNCVYAGYPARPTLRDIDKD